ncbi:MAG: YtxH domain-containing protein [Alistipes sp.]|nr:YtxH domain-containing protein [Alistipes sp.]
MKNTCFCFASLVGGLLVGSALTMLLTPQSGPELRAAIKDFIDKEVDKARCQCHDNDID